MFFPFASAAWDMVHLLGTSGYVSSNKILVTRRVWGIVAPQSLLVSVSATQECSPQQIEML